MPSEETWRLAPGRDLLWQKWPEGGAVFDPASGNTQFLNLMACVALERLEGGPLNSERLTREVSEYLDIPLDDLLRSNLDSLISHFDSLGLIESCSNTE
ncbi:MAG: HPr-rel-A system PqqD family peptide chaperone [Sphingomonadales bacterium]|nr:HPr-rel-A system PqqD family peptide chaperone [Sphingomonadales bacterium]